MIKFDRLLFSVLFGIAVPLFCFILSWWGTFIFTSDQRIIIIAALSGLCVGIIISILIKLICRPKIYGLSGPLLIIVYLFYNCILFAMFMGIPFFHLFLGIVAGYYWAKYLIHHTEITDYKKEIQRISIFAAAITGLICVASASIALITESTAREIQSMFNLPFDISRPLLVTSVIAGGILMIAVQYLLVKFTMKRTLSKNMTM
jgi:hypothetical protein